MGCREIDPSPRLIMGPGPVDADPRILRAMSAALVGQFDPEMTDLMDDTSELLRRVFLTANRWAFPVDGSSRAGLEAVLCSLIEPGDRVLVPVCGRFGYLFAEIALRCRADVRLVEAEWGRIVDPETVRSAMRDWHPKLVCVIHGETSTGILQPLEEIGRTCRETDALLVVDAVATLGGTPVRVDDWGIDACVSGLQKCLSGPSGSAPLTYDDRVERVLVRRRRVEWGLREDPTGMRPDMGVPIQSNYLDLAMLQDYWSPQRLNHHTESTTLLYGLHEALRCVLDEGLEARWARHRTASQAVEAGLQAMGLQLFGDPAFKLPNVTAVHIPAGVDGERVRSALLEDFGIEIGTSFGPLKGRVWRIGTMGHACRKRSVLLCLGALEAALRWQGADVTAGAGVDAAVAVYRAAGLATAPEVGK